MTHLIEGKLNRTSAFVIFHVVLTGALACPLSLPGVIVTSCGVCDIYGEEVSAGAEQTVTDYERDPRD